MNLDLINERYTDHRYHSYYLLKEHWNSYTDDDKRFIKECENITNSVFPELLQEGPFDKFKSKAAGAWAGAKNLKKSLTGRGAEAEDVGQAKLNKRVQLFQSSVGKVLGELKRDLGKMGIEGEDHPTIQAMNYIVGSANQIGTEQYPIEVKAGLGGRMADKALEWTNTKIQDLLTKIKAEADKSNTFSGSQQEFDAINKQRAAKMMPPLVKQLRGVKAAGKALQAIEKFATEHPKWTNFSIGVLVAASRLVALPGSGIIVGLFLRSAVGVIKGEDIQQAVTTAAKVATVGALAGAAIGEIGDALSDNSDQVAGVMQQAGAAGEDAAGEITQSPDFDGPGTDFAGGTDEPFSSQGVDSGPDSDYGGGSETGMSDVELDNAVGDAAGGEIPDMTTDPSGWDEAHRNMKQYFAENPGTGEQYHQMVNDDYTGALKLEQELGVPDGTDITQNAGKINIDPSAFPNGEITNDQLEAIQARCALRAELAAVAQDIGHSNTEQNALGFYKHAALMLKKALASRVGNL